ncbi:MAG: acyl transferase [Bacteroidetes bacterium]|nr:MAG: acyl transferase [Bacteroidota bacterium]
MIQKIAALPDADFEETALEVFRFQYFFNPVYRTFVDLLGVDYQSVNSISRLPFLPISAFKNHVVRTGDWTPETVFTSSGTTGSATSRHWVRNLDFYTRNTVRGFEVFYGSPADYCVLALLPSYLEREGSGLISMVAHFIALSKYRESGFFLRNHDELVARITKCQKKRIPVLLIGVSFALLDLAEAYELNLEGVIVMETGGMKGRRREMTREELHGFLKERFHVPEIHSEYGMTEMFSQAYARKSGRFFPAPTLRVLSREMTDPLTLQKTGKTGALNLIDLANFDTASFIATDDLGRVYENHSFEVLGRMDASDARGCNLLLLEK